MSVEVKIVSVGDSTASAAINTANDARAVAMTSVLNGYTGITNSHTHKTDNAHSCCT